MAEASILACGGRTAVSLRWAATYLCRVSQAPEQLQGEISLSYLEAAFSGIRFEPGYEKVGIQEKAAGSLHAAGYRGTDTMQTELYAAV